jgi:hypothetical protein
MYRGEQPQQQQQYRPLPLSQVLPAQPHVHQRPAVVVDDDRHVELPHLPEPNSLLSGVIPTTTTSGMYGNNGQPLNGDQQLLWQMASEWFASVRPTLGVNSTMDIDTPTASGKGVFFRVVGLKRNENDILNLFRNFSPRCTQMTNIFGDVTDPQGTITQLIPYEVLDDFRTPIYPDPQLQQQQQQQAKKKFLTRFANEPSWIMSTLLATVVSASATTKLATWTSILRTIGVMVGLVG